MTKKTRFFAIIAALAAIGFSTAGCDNNTSPGGTTTPTFTVAFDSAGGSPVAPQTVPQDGSLATEPADPLGVPGAGLWDGNVPNFVEWRYGDTAWNFATGIVTGNITLTAHWDGPAVEPTGVAPNDVAAAVAYVNANASAERAFTLVISQDVESGENNLTANYTNLTIIGLGGPHEIRHTDGLLLFRVESAVSNASLTLDNGITLRGRWHTGGLVRIVGSTNTFAMEDGSKITGNISHGGGGFAWGAVRIDGGSTFYMRGGTITGNRGDAGLGDVGGVWVSGTGSSLIQTGESSIIDNTTASPSEHPNVRLTDGATRTVNGEPAGNS